MDEDCETAFKCLIKSLLKGNTQAIIFYNGPQNVGKKFEEKGLTSKGITDLAYGYFIKDKPDVFGVTEKQAILMRGFVKQNLYNGISPEKIYTEIGKLL